MQRNERGYAVPTLASDAVLVEGDEVLLVQRGKAPFEGAWALPGGFMEVGETVEQACLRELKEETGIAAWTKAMVGVYSDPTRDPRGHVVSVVFLVERESENAGGAVAGDDAEKVGWFSLKDAPELAFDHAEILADARGLLEEA